MPATDTAQPSDTTPPSPAGGGKTGKGGSASKAPAAAAADQTPVATPDAPVETAEDSAAEPPAPKPGWFRNTGAVELTVMPDQYPSAKLAPGEATWLPDDPRHPNLERCDAPTPDAPAADTAGSEK
jgi:hypothetical protein